MGKGFIIILFWLLISQHAVAGNVKETELHNSTSAKKEEAIDDDILQLSRDTGFSIEQIKESLAFQKRFNQYVEELKKRYPGKLSIYWSEPIPKANGTIRFIDKVPAGALLIKSGFCKQLTLPIVLLADFLSYRHS